jgi:hypothetical protein
MNQRDLNGMSMNAINVKRSLGLGKDGEIELRGYD